MTGQRDRPWSHLYPPTMPSARGPVTTSVPVLFDRLVTQAPDAPLLYYYGRTLTRSDTADLARRIEAVLQGSGVGVGSRVGVCLQNTPVCVATVLAIWHVGATVVPLNPMLRERELAHVLEDAQAVALVAHPETYELLETLPAPVREAFVSYGDDLAGTEPGPWPDRVEVPGIPSLLSLAADVDPSQVSPTVATLDDAALLTYTSGTTGPSKGAVNSHGNMAYVVDASRRWFRLDSRDGILATAPLFHITGMVVHLALSLGTGCPLTLTYRFDPATVARLIEAYRPTFTVGSITAFIALMNCPDRHLHDLGSLTNVFSGGAPVSVGTVERYEQEIGPYIHNIYGLTETTSACIGVPRGVRAPTDSTSGALSIGVPLPGTDVRIVGEDGQALPCGQAGEIAISGPGVVSGYWQRPEETRRAIHDGWLLTGDVGTMDADGWLYVVDRKKDLIIASGYKIWPRDVEDVLYEHPAVLEAAVIGAPDPYRGETVYAYVSLRDGGRATELELIEHCRNNLAAYKAPRRIEILPELPKTATGKILRRELRVEHTR